MSYTVSKIRQLQKKVLINRELGKEDWYEGMELDEVETLFKHATQGYRCRSSDRFMYPDVQCVFYIRIKLMKKYLYMLDGLGRRKEAAHWLDWFETAGWVYTSQLNGESVLGNSEAMSVIERMNRGTYPENARNIHGWDSQYWKEHTLPKGKSKADAWLEANPPDPQPPFFRVLGEPISPTPIQTVAVQLNLF